MKVIYKSFFILITLITISLTSCTDEAVVPVNPAFEVSYIRDGQLNCYAGTPITIYKTGSSEFSSLYDGTSLTGRSKIYGEPGAKGIDLRDSIVLTYKERGTYQMTFVATSSAKFGKEFVREVKSVEVNVLDYRNEFTAFSVDVPLLKNSISNPNGTVKGVISKDSVILSMPDVVKDFNLKGIFTFDSQKNLPTVTVNDVPQVKGVTSNNFNPAGAVIYTVKSVDGDKIKNYAVKVRLVPSSTQKKLMSFKLSGSTAKSEEAKIDEENHTVTITAITGTTLDKVKFAIESSIYSTVSIGKLPATTGGPLVFSNASKTAFYNISGTGTGPVSVIRVTAQDLTYQDYTLIVNKSL